MLRIIAIFAAIAFSLVASATQDSRKEDDGMKIPGQYVKQGTSIDCLAEGGCIVMTPQELAATANAIYRKTLEMHTCGLKSTV